MSNNLQNKPFIDPDKINYIENIAFSHWKLNNMEEAFITSTGIGLLPCYWDGWESDYKITKLIKKELFKRIKNH